VQNLVIAAEDTLYRFSIAEKFVEEILPLALNLAEDGEKEKVEENFNVYDISCDLADGTLEDS